MAVMVSSYGLQVPFGNTNTFIRSVVGCLSVLMFLNSKIAAITEKSICSKAVSWIKKIEEVHVVS